MNSARLHRRAIPPATASLERDRRRLVPGNAALLAVVLVAAVLAAYANALSAAFVFDDLTSVLANPTIRHLWPPNGALSPPHDGSPVDGRPLVNLSLAFNFAISGTRPWSYHAFNIVVHAVAALALFWIVRDAIARLRSRDAASAAKPTNFSATTIAFAVALLWAVHPLQTAAVTYVAQRAESLAALFVLLTVALFARGIDTPRRRTWHAYAVTACALGVLCKETAAVTPLVVLLYDRTFISGKFSAALRRHPLAYAGLACTWLIAAFLVLGTHARAGTAGFGSAVTPWGYTLTQCSAIVRYLGLSFWPSPLVFDYGTALVTRASSVLLPAALLIALLAATALALRRRPALGFCGACFFLLLAPSSSVIPVATQTIAEHRMYLPLAALIAAIVPALFAAAGKRTIAGVLLAALALGFATARRNRDYASEVAIWTDTVAKRPDNARAHNNLGAALARAGRTAEATTSFERALQLDPDDAGAHTNLGNLYLERGRVQEALEHHRAAVRLAPDSAVARLALGTALLAARQPAEALTELEVAARLDPHRAEAQYQIGIALAQTGRIAEAIPRYEKAIALNPDYPEAHYNLANALAQTARPADAISHYETALQLRPGYIAALHNLGNALLILHRAPEAIARYTEVVRLEPNSPEAHTSLGLALMMQRSFTEAAAEFRTALRLRPDYEPARANLARLEAMR